MSVISLYVKLCPRRSLETPTASDVITMKWSYVAANKLATEAKIFFHRNLNNEWIGCFLLLVRIIQLHLSELCVWKELPVESFQASWHHHYHHHLHRKEMTCLNWATMLTRLSSLCHLLVKIKYTTKANQFYGLIPNKKKAHIHTKHTVVARKVTKV